MNCGANGVSKVPIYPVELEANYSKFGGIAKKYLIMIKLTRKKAKQVK